MPNDEWIQNLSSNYKSNNIWSFFGKKNCIKLAKYPIKPIFDNFFKEKGVKCYSFLILGQIGKPLII